VHCNNADIAPHEVQRQLYVRPLQQIKIRRPTLRQWFQHLHQQNQESCPLPYHRLYPLCRNGRQRQSVDESIMAIMFTLASMVPFITSHACGMVQTHAIARPCSRWLVVLNTEFIMELTSCWRTSRKTCNNPHRTLACTHLRGLYRSYVRASSAARDVHSSNPEAGFFMDKIGGYSCIVFIVSDTQWCRQRTVLYESVRTTAGAHMTRNVKVSGRMHELVEVCLRSRLRFPS